MTEAQAAAVQSAAQLLSENSGMARERILNFAEDARLAIRSALHRSFPATPDLVQHQRYVAVKKAAKVIEEFHGMKP